MGSHMPQAHDGNISVSFGGGVRVKDFTTSNSKASATMALERI